MLWMKLRMLKEGDYPVPFSGVPMQSQWSLKQKEGRRGESEGDMAMEDGIVRWSTLGSDVEEVDNETKDTGGLRSWTG